MKAKLIGLVLIFSFALLIVAFVGFYKLTSVNNNLNDLLGSVAKQALIAGNIDSKVNEMRNREKTLVLEETEDGLKKSSADMDKLTSDLIKHVDDYDKLTDESGKKNIATMRALITQWQPITAEVKKLTKENKKSEATHVVLTKTREIVREIAKLTDEMSNRNAATMKARSGDITLETEKSKIIIFWISLIALVSGGTISFFMIKNIMADQATAANLMEDAVRSYNMVEKSSTSTLMGSVDGKIIYLNEAAKKSLRKLVGCRNFQAA